MQSTFKRPWIGTLFLIAWCALVPGASGADISVIVHKDVAVDSLTQAELRDIYLGDRSTWSNGQPVVFVILERGDAHERFMKNHIKKTGDGFIRHWKKISMTGKGRMPRAFVSEADLLAFVAQTPGAIGYIADVNKNTQIRILPIR